MTTEPLRRTGLEVPDYMPWGTHCCHFFQTETDLLETLIPFFQHIQDRLPDFDWRELPERITSGRIRQRHVMMVNTYLNRLRARL